MGNNMIIKEQQSSIINADFKDKKVTKPTELSKKEFGEFFNEISKEFFEDINMGNPNLCAIPDNVRVPKYRNFLHEFNGNTYSIHIERVKDEKYLMTAHIVLNDVITDVKMVKTIYNNKSPKKPTFRTDVYCQKQANSRFEHISLDGKGKSNEYTFKEQVHSANARLNCELAQKDFAMIKEQMINMAKGDTYSLVNAGVANVSDLPDMFVMENAGITKSSEIIPANKFGEVKVSDDLYVTLDTSQNARLPKMYLGECNTQEILYNTLDKIFKVYKGRIEPFIALGTAILCVFIEDFWKKRSGYPVVFLEGKTQQGKSLVQGIIMNIFGYSSNCKIASTSTHNGIATACFENNGIPQIINDYKIEEFDTNSFEHYIKAMNEGDVKRRQSKTSNHNDMYYCTSGIFSSNFTPPAKQEILNRLLLLYFPENGIDTTYIDEKFGNDERRSKILAEIFKINFNDLYDVIEQTQDWFISLNLWDKKCRETYNLALAYTGIAYLEKFADYTIPDKNKRFLEYCEWYHDFFTKTVNKVELFLRAIPSLIAKRNLEVNMHYMFEEKDGKYYFIFDTQDCIYAYNSSLESIENKLDPQRFAKDLKASHYYKDRKTKYYSRRKGGTKASSTILDLTEYSELENIKKVIENDLRVMDATRAIMPK